MEDILEIPFYGTTGLKEMISYDYGYLLVTNFDEFNKLLFKTIGKDNLKGFLCLKDEILNLQEKKIILTLKEEAEYKFKSPITDVSNDFKDCDEDIYNPKINEAFKKIIRYVKTTNEFIKNNKDEILPMLDNNILELKKKAREASDKKYAEKRKLLRASKEKTKLTEEQKKENKRLANEKYRKQQKEKLLNLGETKQISAEKKREYNTTYYTKQKEMKNRIKELEAKLSKYEPPENI